VRGAARDADAEAALRIYDPEHTPKPHAQTVALRDRVAARLAALEGGSDR
jgi:hypothetical protein